jgi:hypothetical protein
MEQRNKEWKREEGEKERERKGKSRREGVGFYEQLNELHLSP